MKNYYVALPKTLVPDTPLYQEVQQRIERAAKALSGDEECKLTVGVFRSVDEWQYLWEQYSDEWAQNGLFFAADEQGYIGKGVWDQMLDVLIRIGAPVWYVDAEGYHVVATIAKSEVDFTEPDESNWKQYTKPFLVSKGE